MAMPRARRGNTSGDFPNMFRTLVRFVATVGSIGLVVVLLGAFADPGETGGMSTERGGVQSGSNTADARLFVPPTTLAEQAATASEPVGSDSTAADASATPSTIAAGTRAADTPASPSSVTTNTTATTTTTTTAVGQAPGPGPSPSPTSTTTTTITAAPASTPTTTTTTTAQPVSSGSGMFLWDTAWQIAAKSNESAINQYVGRLASASGAGGANVTGFWFSVVNINQDINTPNGFGHTFGSFSNPNPDYLDYVEMVISKAAGRGLRVGIVVAWDGPNQFSVDSGKLNGNNAYDYGHAIASQWTRSEFGGRWAISAWIMGGDTTRDSGGEHGGVWAEVVRGIKAAEAENGFGGAPVLLHTAPGQHLHYTGASWLSAHAPQTGHCADRSTAVNWMNELRNTGARVWGNGEMRYEDITWSCNGNRPISADDVLGDAIAMANLGYMANFVYGHDDRWNSSWPGAAAMGSGGSVSEGLQRILDEPGLIRSR
ncbi:MAG: DUF4038 domain-containing protein [Acidimicrobiia bacterium]|nr:MAG: DUF4038 domain-containing protein [Acidimicrobiia bacterium]